MYIHVSDEGNFIFPKNLIKLYQKTHEYFSINIYNTLKSHNKHHGKAHNMHQGILFEGSKIPRAIPLWC